jgi:membrane-associated phospholipid phosphatase
MILFQNEASIQGFLRSDLFFFIRKFLQAGTLGNIFGRAFWEVVSISADGVVWFLRLPAMNFYTPQFLLWKPSPDIVRLVAIGLVSDVLIIVALKQIFRRRRPSHHRPDFRFVGPDQFSFPSGHATRAWLIAGLVSARFAGEDGYATTHRLAATWAAVVSLGRVALGRHYVSDVICGGLVGLLVTAPLSVLIHRQFFSSAL